MEFEGKQFKSMSAIADAYFPTRSKVWVADYLKQGCKTVSEVVNASERKYAQGLVASRKAARRSPFGQGIY